MSPFHGAASLFVFLSLRGAWMMDLQAFLAVCTDRKHVLSLLTYINSRIRLDTLNLPVRNCVALRIKVDAHLDNG